MDEEGVEEESVEEGRASVRRKEKGRSVLLKHVAG